MTLSEGKSYVTIRLTINIVAERGREHGCLSFMWMENCSPRELMAAERAWLQDFLFGQCLGDLTMKVSLHGGLQLRLRLRDGDSVEVQSL